MGFKGTKGEWEFNNPTGYDGDIICDDQEICTFAFSDIRDKKELISNAKLIAAAPILLDALINIVNQFKKIDRIYSKDKQLIEFAEDAIKKATE